MLTVQMINKENVIKKTREMEFFEQKDINLFIDEVTSLFSRELIYKRHVTLGISLRAINQFAPKRIDCSPFWYIPKGNEEAVWLEPELVCIVESMPTEKESFRQPVFKGIRNDKQARECMV